MNDRLYGIIKDQIEILKLIQNKLEEEYSMYAEDRDFDAIVLLKAIKNLDIR